MATERIVTRVGKTQMAKMSHAQLIALLNSAQDDLAALRNSITTLTAKLDLDAGVTDTNYASLCNPAALTFTK